jgi:hypothetical protein
LVAGFQSIKDFMFRVSILAVMITIVSSCDQSVDQSKKSNPKSAESDLPSDVVEDEEDSDINFSVLIPSGKGGSARLGKTRVYVDENTFSKDVRITLKRTQASTFSAEDAAVLTGSELINVEVTDAESNQIISKNELSNPLRIQTSVKESAASTGDYYAALLLKDSSPSGNVVSRSAIRSEDMSDVADDTVNGLHLAAIRKQFLVSAIQFTFGIVYAGEVNPIFAQQNEVIENETISEGENSGNGSTTQSGSYAGSLALDTAWGLQGFSTVKDGQITVADEIFDGTSTSYACGSANNNPGTKYFVSKMNVTSSATLIDSFGESLGMTYITPSGGDSAKCLKISRNANGKIMTLYSTTSASTGTKKLRMVEVNPSAGVGSPTALEMTIDYDADVLDFKLKDDNTSTFLLQSSTSTKIFVTLSDGTIPPASVNGMATLSGTCNKMVTDSAGNNFVACVSTGTYSAISMSYFDTGFNSRAHLGMSGTSIAVTVGTLASITGLYVASDGSSTVMGRTDNSQNGELHWFLVRFNAAGTNDTSFGTSGKMVGSQDKFRVNNSFYSESDQTFFFCGTDLASGVRKLAITAYQASSNSQATMSVENSMIGDRNAATCRLHTNGMYLVPTGMNGIVFMRAKF